MAQLGARVNGIHEVTGSIPVWSTKYSIHRKWLKVRGLGGSIARNVGFDNVLISNDILLETRLKSNRTHQTASMS